MAYKRGWNIIQQIHIRKVDLKAYFPAISAFQPSAAKNPGWSASKGSWNQEDKCFTSNWRPESKNDNN